MAFHGTSKIFKSGNNHYIPLTLSLVEHSALPNELTATTLYSPLCSGPTLRMYIEQTPYAFVM